MTRIGLFLNGKLVTEYPNTVDMLDEVVEDFTIAVQETGKIHEIKLFENSSVFDS